MRHTKHHWAGMMAARRLPAAGMLALAALALLLVPAVCAGDMIEIQMTAKKYEFSPSTITVRKGDQVKLIVTALDHDHGLKLDAFHINQKLVKGEPTTIEFTADQAGTFPFECSVFCGLGHKKMKGTLVVEE